MARQTPPGRKKASPRRSIRSERLSMLTGSEGWIFDPNMTRLVKSGVDDIELVNQRRSQFVRTAISLFCRKGYHVTTIKEIADAAGMSAGLIYHYVTDKEDVLFLALQLIVHTLKRGMPEDLAKVAHPVEKLMVAFTEYVRVIDANRDACMLTYRETKSLTREHREAIKGLELETNELIADCVRAGIKAGYFREVDVTLFVYQVIMVAQTWAIKHWRVGEVASLDRYIEAQLDTLMRGVATAKGEQAYLRLRSARRRLPLSIG